MAERGAAKLALLALLAGLAALAGSVAAQTGGQTDTLEGRIIARIQDRTDANGNDDYRIEFGFLPQWAMDEKDPWTEAAATYAEWLPESRWLSKARLEQREADDDRRWLRSSLISVPRSKTGAQPGGGDADLLTDSGLSEGRVSGRVIARYQPDAGGRLRVEFGFLPEWAFEATADTAEAVQRYGADLLPSARFLSASMIAERRDVWLRSSIVRVPASAPTAAPMSAPKIALTRTTLAFKQGEAVEAIRIGAVEGALSTESEPISVTGMPASLTITAVDAGENLKRLVLQGQVAQDAALRSYSVQITARPPRGAAVTATLQIRIEADARDQQLSWRGYSPAARRPGEAATLIPPRVETGPSAPQWTYTSDTPSLCTVDGTSGALTLLARGVCRVTATSAAADGFRAGVVRATVTVTDKIAPDLLWFDYAVGSVVAGGDAILPNRPAANDRVGSLSYRSETPRICSVDSRSGSLSGLEVGVCRATVISNETGDLRDGSRTITISVSAKPGPSACALRYPESVDVDNSVNADLDCGDGDATYRSETPRTCSVNSGSGAVTGIAGGQCRIVVSVAATSRHGEAITRAALTVNRAQEEDQPTIDSISCTPSSPKVDEDVTCRAELSGGTPDTWAWDNPQEGLSGSNIPFFTLFRSDGDKTISLTVTNTGGSDTKSITVTVTAESTEPAVEAPVIDSISCAPSSPKVDDDVTCRAELSGGTPDTWAWNNPREGLRGNNIPFFTRFLSAGDRTISLTVTNDGGSDTESITVTVEAAEPTEPVGDAPAIDGISCTPSSPKVNDNVTCRATLSGGTPTTWAWDNPQEGLRGSNIPFFTLFRSTGSKTISLTVSNADGSDTESITVTVETTTPPVDAPTIDSISCTPSSPEVDAAVTCSASISGGSATFWSWSGGDSGGRSASYRTSFGSAGAKTVSLTASNAGGSDSESITVTVTGTEPVTDTGTTAGQPPQITNFDCTQEPDEEPYEAMCTANVVNGDPNSWTWSWSDSDGGSSTVSYAYHPFFYSPGTKTVSLTVSNPSGSDSDSTTITIE